MPAPLPDDDAFRAALASTPADLRQQLDRSLRELMEALAAGAELVTWTDSRKTGDNTWTMPWVDYDDILWNALQAARSVIAATGLGPFRAETLPTSIAEVDDGSLSAAAVFLDSIHHRERIADGLIEDCLNNGTFGAALEKLASALQR